MSGRKKPKRNPTSICQECHLRIINKKRSSLLCKKCAIKRHLKYFREYSRKRRKEYGIRRKV